MDTDISTYTEQVLSTFVNLIISGVVKSVRHQGYEITFLVSKCSDANEDILTLHGGLSLNIQKQLEGDFKNPNKEAAQDGHCSIIPSKEEPIPSNHPVSIPITEALAAASSQDGQTCNTRTVMGSAAHADTSNVECNSDEEQEVQIKLQLPDDMQVDNDVTLPESFLKPEQTNSAAATTTFSSNTSYENLRGKIKCKYCKYTSIRKSEMISHMRTHTGEKPFACPECPHRSARQSTMKKHMLTHIGKKKFGCPKCPYTSKRQATMKRHILTHTQVKPFARPKCPYKSAHKTCLRRHILIHTGEKPFACQYCLFRSAQKKGVTRHALKHTEGNQLHVDTSNTKRVKESVAHVNIIDIEGNSDNPVSIPTADDLAAATNDPTSNTRTVMESAAHVDTINLECSSEFEARLIGDTEYSPTTDNDAEKPVVYSSSYRIIECEDAGNIQSPEETIQSNHPVSIPITDALAAASSHDSLTSYTRTVMESAAYEDTIKEECTVEFDGGLPEYLPTGDVELSQTTDYDADEPSENDDTDTLNEGQEVPIKLELQDDLQIENDVTLTESLLQPEPTNSAAATTTLSSNRPTRYEKLGSMKCKYCNYTSIRKSQLILHTRTHTGEKPFACPECPHRSARQSAMKKHILTHIGKNKFGCPKCPYTSERQATMKRHILTHAQAKPFACPECPYRAVDKTCLKRHILIHTGEKPFACQYCPFRSAQKKGVKRHALKHTTENHLLLDTSNTRTVMESAAHMDTSKVECNSGFDGTLTGDAEYSPTTDVPEAYSSGDRFIECEDALNIQSPEDALQTNHPVNIQITHALVDTMVQSTLEASASPTGYTEYSLTTDLGEQEEYTGGEILIECQEQELQNKIELPNDLHIELDRTTTTTPSVDPTDEDFSDEKNCQYCEFKTSSKSELKKHMRTHIAEKILALNALIEAVNSHI